jgi:hypothetical protein
MPSIAQPTQAVIFVGMQASGKTSFYRQRFFETHLRISLDMARTRQRVVAYFFLTSLQDAIRRNRQRTGKQSVPVPAIAATFRKPLVPSREEGFEALYTGTVAPEGAFVVQPAIGSAFLPPLRLVRRF